MDQNWGDTLFGLLKRVNSQLYKTECGPVAHDALYGLQCSLASGDGLAESSAIRGSMQRILGLTGLTGSVRDSRPLAEGLTEVTLGDNPYGLDRLYFSRSGYSAGD